MTLERRSKLHTKVVDYLLEHYPLIRIVEEYKIGSNQFIDIYLQTYKIALEIQGIQHTKYIPFFHGDKSESKFEYQKIRDRRKQLLCSKAGIMYFEVFEQDDLPEKFKMIFDTYNEVKLLEIEDAKRDVDQ